MGCVAAVHMQMQELVTNRELLRGKARQASKHDMATGEDTALNSVDTQHLHDAPKTVIEVAKKHIVSQGAVLFAEADSRQGQIKIVSPALIGVVAALPS
jgi:hypothetical protein